MPYSYQQKYASILLYTFRTLKEDIIYHKLPHQSVVNRILAEGIRNFGDSVIRNNGIFNSRYVLDLIYHKLDQTFPEDSDECFPSAVKQIIAHELRSLQLKLEKFKKYNIPPTSEEYSLLSLGNFNLLNY